MTTITSASVNKVSEMAENLVGSEILKIAGEVNEKIRNGEKIYNLTVGDFDPKIFPIPRLLCDEIVKRVPYQCHQLPAKRWTSRVEARSNKIYYCSRRHRVCPIRNSNSLWCTPHYIRHFPHRG